MDSVAGNFQKYSVLGSGSVSSEVQTNTGLLPDLAKLVDKFVDYSPVFRRLIYSDRGIVVDCEHNQEIIDALAAAMEDPDCPQQVTEYISTNYYCKQLNQLIGSDRIKLAGNLIDVEVQTTTDLPSDLSKLVRQYTDYSAAMQQLELDQSGEIIESEENQLVVSTADAALSDPDCPRAVINAFFRNFPGKTLNHLMADKLKKGEAINLDRTDLNFPDFTGLVLTDQFSAQHASFYRPKFTGATIAGNLEGLEVIEPSCKGMSVSNGARLDAANLLNNFLGEY